MRDGTEGNEWEREWEMMERRVSVEARDERQRRMRVVAQGRPPVQRGQHPARRSHGLWRMQQQTGAERWRQHCR